MTKWWCISHENQTPYYITQVRIPTTVGAWEGKISKPVYLMKHTAAFHCD